MINLGDLIGVMHGRCAIEAIGVDELLRYPLAELSRLTLDDIGPDAMRRVVEKAERAENRGSMLIFD
jgi:hypothetical protein